MTGLLKLLDDIAIAMRACPEIVNLAEIVPYPDLATSDFNSLSRTIYAMPNGSVLIAWQSSGIGDEPMLGWAHRIDIYARSMRRQSPLMLLNAIIDGVPAGETIRWRYLCVNEDVLPMEIEEIARLIDEEGIDYYVIRSVFREKGDY